MNRTLLLILVLSICLSLCACTNNDGYTTDPTESSSTTTESTEISIGNTENSTENTDGTTESTEIPTDEPTSPPSEEPTEAPTETPTEAPTETPTEEATTPPTTVPEETESEEEQMQKLIDYNKALDLLADIDVYFTLDQVDAMDKAYQLLINLGDYKDASKILSCFTMHTLKVNNNLDWKYISNQNGDLVAYFTNSAIYCTNTYDNNGNLIRVDYTDPKHKTEPHYRIYEYNDAGQLMRHEYITGQHIIYCWTYEYNTSVNETIEYYKYNEVLQRTTTITYADGVVVKEYMNFGDSHQEATYTYDEKGQVIEKTSYASSNGSLYTYTYAYDESGNVIRESLVREIGDETSYSETTYTYSTVYIYTPPQG